MQPLSLRSARLWIALLVGFALGALTVEFFDPFGPRNREDCVYGLLKRGAPGQASFAVCYDMFPDKPPDLSDLGDPVSGAR